MKDATLKRINNDIVHVKFKTQRLLSETLLRFQEYYESPKFKGKIFTLGEFRKWYGSEYGGFSFYEDVAGFNFPSYALKPFYEGLFDPLTKYESEFIEMFRNREDNFYIIGTYCEDEASEDYLDHELCHALWHTNKLYKKGVNRLLKAADLSKTIKGFTKKLGYHKDVVFDEIQAYLSTDVTMLVDRDIEYPVKKVIPLKTHANRYIRRLRSNQKKFFDP
jgi:hypothetical protein